MSWLWAQAAAPSVHVLAAGAGCEDAEPAPGHCRAEAARAPTPLAPCWTRNKGPELEGETVGAAPCVRVVLSPHDRPDADTAVSLVD